MFLDDMGILKLYWKITAGWMKKIISHFRLSNILEGYCTTDTKYPQVLLLDIFPAHYIGRVNFEAFKKKKKNAGKILTFTAKLRQQNQLAQLIFDSVLIFVMNYQEKIKPMKRTKQELQLA